MKIRQLVPALVRGAAAAVLGIAVPALRAAEPVRPPVVEYRIRASLDPKTHVVDGTERLVWRNPSDDVVSELRFHLYLNAFKNNRSTFFRESGGQLRGSRFDRKSEDWGSIDVLSLSTGAGADLLPSSRKIQPDGNDPSDETVLAVPLAVPVPPRGEISLDISFRSKLPRIFARTGFVRDYHLVGQWFPKIGVYEPAGMRGRAAGGWNCHAFHANSEFYADFGDYDVTLSVPSEFVVGATGRQISAKKTGARTEYRYVQENVHDFAWTADPRFVVREVRFDPARDVPPGWASIAAGELGVSASSLTLKPVSVRLLLQPDHVEAYGRYVEGMRVAVSFYGLWFGAYPYETLTIVDPPEDGFGSGGMEYPTFITGGTHVRLLHWPLSGTRLTEDVVLHEFGHQYFYGMVGSNEFEEPWLDEGLNTDAEYRAAELAWGPQNFARLPGGIGAGWRTIAHLEYAAAPNLDPIHRAAWRFATSETYGVNSYMKVGLFLDQLRNDVGAAAYARAEREFFSRWSFRHPSTDDFFAVFQKSLGRDLTSYRNGIVEGTARLDWKVVSASSGRQAPDAGMFERNGRRVTLEAGAEETARGSLKSSKSKERWGSVVLFGNLGDWPHRARARLAFENGAVVERDLPGDARWVRLSITSGSPLAWAAVDPDRKNPWDANRLNDSLVLRGGEKSADTRSVAAARKYLG
ncbi:MAG TPA: M1 family metallopeptidase, partial [Thermoanaerobaculia bacterium]|nr:M1 family metallopeptidase [Thermoanaerobaculia bacterium]